MKGVLVIAALVALVAGEQHHGCPNELSTTQLPDFKDCAGFWRCADGVSLRQLCPHGLHFSFQLQRCTLPIFARCQAMDGGVTTDTAFASGFLYKLRNLISRKSQLVPLAKDELSASSELSSGELPIEVKTFQRFPDTEPEGPEMPDEADEADGDFKETEKSKEADSENEEEKSADIRRLDTEEEMEQKEKVEDGKREEQEESEQSEEEIKEEDDEVSSEKEESEKSDIVNAATEKDSKKDTTVIKKKDEEEEDEDKISKLVNSVKKENKKNKTEEKEKDSGSDSESDDEE